MFDFVSDPFNQSNLVLYFNYNQRLGPVQTPHCSIPPYTSIDNGCWVTAIWKQGTVCKLIIATLKA